MATEVDFDQAGGKLRARVALDRNAGTWRQIPRPGWARNYPAFGVYVEKLNEGEHLFMFGSAEDPDRDDIPITILRNFFRPKTGKQGMGHAGHLKMKVPGGPVTWTVVNCDQAEAGIAALSFERKCELAIRMAKDKVGSRLPPQLWNLLLNPVLWAVLATHLIKKPRYWLKVTRAALGYALKVWLVLSYAYDMAKIMYAIDKATTSAQLEAAGVALANLLARLGVDLSMGLISELINLKGTLKSAREEGSGALPEPESKPAIPASGHEPASWRDGHTTLINEATWLSKEAEALEGSKRIACLARAASLRFQARILRKFIVETIHHIDWVKRIAGHLNTYIRDLEQICPHGKITPAAVNKLRADFNAAGVDPAGEVNFKQFGQSLLDLGSKQNWSLHDVETALTSKLNAAISHGMKFPFDIRKLGFKDFELQNLAMGKNPEGTTMTPETMERVLLQFKTHAPEMLKVCNEVEGMARAAFEGTKSIGEHTTVPHHSGTNIPALAEGGCDTAHALLQWRHYRLVIMEFEAAVAEVAKMPDVARRPWIRFGLMLFSRVPGKDYCDPRTVSHAALAAYEADDLLELSRRLKFAGKK